MVFLTFSQQFAVTQSFFQRFSCRFSPQTHLLWFSKFFQCSHGDFRTSITHPQSRFVEICKCTRKLIQARPESSTNTCIKPVLFFSSSFIFHVFLNCPLIPQFSLICISFSLVFPWCSQFSVNVQMFSQMLCCFSSCRFVIFIPLFSLRASQALSNDPHRWFTHLLFFCVCVYVFVFYLTLFVFELSVVLVCVYLCCLFALFLIDFPIIATEKTW